MRDITIQNFKNESYVARVRQMHSKQPSEFISSEGADDTDEKLEYAPEGAQSIGGNRIGEDNRPIPEATDDGRSEGFDSDPDEPITMLTALETPGWQPAGQDETSAYADGEADTHVPSRTQGIAERSSSQSSRGFAGAPPRPTVSLRSVAPVGETAVPTTPVGSAVHRPLGLVRVLTDTTSV